MRSEKFVIGLDIGTTKVCAVVGRASGRSADVAAYGTASCGGLRKGVIVDMDAAVEAIRSAVAEAEASSGIEINAAYIGIAGSHIKCIESFGAAGVKGREITKADMERVIESAASVYVPLDRDVLHVLPSDFVIDGQEGIVRPVGMSGVRLEAKVNIVTASHSVVENLAKCCEKAGVRPIEVVLEPIATSRAVLGEDEMESGVALIDIGGGTTDLAIYRQGRLRHTCVIPIGGNHLTNDIAIGLRVSQKEAERVKKLYGCALSDGIGVSEEMDAIMMNGEERKIPRRYMADILRPRCEELFGIVRQEIGDNMLYCAVLTGGTSLLGGLDRLAEAILGLPTRLGVPGCRQKQSTPNVEAAFESLRSPIYSTAIGLMLWGHEREVESGLHEEVIGKIAGWLRGIRVPGFRQAQKIFASKIQGGVNV